jgi:F-type H+-transporting ATPase subunit b
VLLVRKAGLPKAISDNSLIGAARLRPAIPTRVFPSISASIISTRRSSNVPTEDPKRKAQSIIDSLPGNNLITKTAILSAGAGVSIFGISNEFLVINEETVVAFCLLSVFWAIGKYGGPMYSEWANGQIEKMKGIFRAAREDHTAAVQSRINNVQQLGSVIDVTKQLFEVSKVCCRV